MGQNVRSGGAFGGSGRSLQADQALEALEAEFNPPSQAIEGENIGGCEGFRLQRRYQDHPVGGIERLLRDGMASALCLPARLAPRLLGRLLRLPDRDQTHGEKRAALAFYPDRAINQAGHRIA